MHGLGYKLNSRGFFRFFVTDAQLILIVCVIGLPICSHNAENFRAIRRNTSVKLINYRQIQKIIST